MSKVLFVSLFLLVQSFSFGQSLIDTSYLFVFAESGLNLRTNPDQNSEVITTVKYGEAIFPIEISEPLIKIDGVFGKWIKVEYRGSHGFMFSGFLSNLPRPQKILKNLNKLQGPIYTLNKYFEFILFKIDQTNTVVIKKCGDDPDCKQGVNKEISPLNKGFQFIDTHSWDSYDREIIGKNWSFEDAKDIVDSVIEIYTNKYKIKLIESNVNNKKSILYRNSDFTILIKETSENQTSIRWETSY